MPEGTHGFGPNLHIQTAEILSAQAAKSENDPQSDLGTEAGNRISSPVNVQVETHVTIHHDQKNETANSPSNKPLSSEYSQDNENRDIGNARSEEGPPDGGSGQRGMDEQRTTTVNSPVSYSEDPIAQDRHRFWKHAVWTDQNNPDDDRI